MNRNQLQDKMSSLRGWSADEDRAALLKSYAKKLGYTENVTGDVATGDQVIFARATFEGSYKRPRFAGIEVISGKVVADSYGKAKQQHTFTISTSKGSMRIKGRNLYSIAVFAKSRCAEERQASLDDKHKRGDRAREISFARKTAESELYF